MKSVYTGGEKVAEFESYDELRVGDSKPAFIYEGSELVYPSPVKEGLVLWYDFSGRTNADGQRGIAEDLSGKGNHGTLQNFNYTSESGYDKNKLLFDGVDDYVSQKKMVSSRTLEVVFSYSAETTNRYQSVISTYTHTGVRSGMSINLIGKGITAFGASPTSQMSSSTGNQNLEEGKLYHVVVTAGNDSCSIYINGELKSNTVFIDYVPEQIGSSHPGVYLGQWNSYAIYKHLGETCSAKVYNRPLTPEEITHNYAIEKERFGIE